MKDVIALIPARGGSKRLPRKNIIHFDGKPIIAYTIAAAQKSQRFNRIVVSTEDAEIAEIAAVYGADIDWRADVLASDDAKLIDVCSDFIVRHHTDKSKDNQLAVLYPAAPLREAKDIHGVMDLLSAQCHFAMAVAPCEWPAHQVLWQQGDQIRPVFPDLVNLRSSEVAPFFIDNGSTYAFHAWHFMQEKTFYGASLQAYLMDAERSVDIDTAADLAKALHYFKSVPV